VLTMDLHAQQVQGFFDIPVDHLYSLPVLIKYLPKTAHWKNGGRFAGSRRAQNGLGVRRRLGANLAIVARTAPDATETEAAYLIGEVKATTCS